MSLAIRNIFGVHNMSRSCSASGSSPSISERKRPEVSRSSDSECKKQVCTCTPKCGGALAFPFHLLGAEDRAKIMDSKKSDTLVEAKYASG